MTPLTHAVWNSYCEAFPNTNSLVARKNLALLPPERLQEIALKNRQHPTQPDSLRYHFPVRDPRTWLLRLYFEKAFTHQPEQIISALETLRGKPLYPLWKRVVKIELPRLLAYALTCRLLYVAIVITIIRYWLPLIFIWRWKFEPILYHRLSLLSARLLPLAFLNSVHKVRAFFYSFRRLLVLPLAYTLWNGCWRWIEPDFCFSIPSLNKTFDVGMAVIALCSPPLATMSKISDMELNGFSWSNVLDPLFIAPAMFLAEKCGDLGGILQNFADKEEEEQLALRKEEAWSLFREAESQAFATILQADLESRH